MRLTTLLLCDFAQIREGLLFISSGGITRVGRGTYPAPAGFAVAMMVELTRAELDRPHELKIMIMGSDRPVPGSATVALQASSDDLAAGETLNVPLVVDLRMVDIPEPGLYSVTVTGDDEDLGMARFEARETRPSTGEP